MSRICQVTGRRPGFGMAVSHSHHRTKRRFTAGRYDAVLLPLRPCVEPDAALVTDAEYAAGPAGWQQLSDPFPDRPIPDVEQGAA